MEKYALGSLAVTRVLLCLNCIRKQSLSAVRVQYKKRYPPSRLENVQSVHERYGEIEHILSFLVGARLVWVESIPSHCAPHEVEKVYMLSRAGALHMRKKK